MKPATGDSNGQARPFRSVRARVFLTQDERNLIVSRAEECRQFHRGQCNASGFIRLAARGLRPPGKSDQELHEIWWRIEIMLRRFVALVNLAGKTSLREWISGTNAHNRRFLQFGSNL